MVKRSRAAVRPGQRRPIQRRVGASPGTPAPSAAAGAAPAVRPTTGLTEAEARRAEELEAQIRADERAADDARRRAVERSRTKEDVGRPAGSLAVVAAHEYDYVMRDIKRIGIVAAILLAILLAIWYLVEVARVISVV